MSTDARDSAGWAAALGLTTLAWYAMPDLIRRPAARGLAKTALLGAGAAASWAKMPRSELDSWISDQVWGTREVLGAGLGVATAAGLTILGERVIYAFGERRRARGVRLAHTLPALGLAALGAAIAVVPAPKQPPVD